MKKKQLLVMVLAMVCIATISITATLAYFTDTDTVTNTFTVGHVDIELDEYPVDDDGKTESTDTCVKKEEYKLYPGKNYDKTPHFHIAKDSEDCYVFVKVENGIADIESKREGYVSIHNQMIAEGWSIIDQKNGIYQYNTKCTNGQKIDTFAKFEIDSSVDAETLAKYEDAEIILTGYAIQAEGFNTAAEAWAANGGSDNFKAWTAEATPAPTATPETP